MLSLNKAHSVFAIVILCEVKGVFFLETSERKHGCIF
jgi:hypothetical protein